MDTNQQPNSANAEETVNIADEVKNFFTADFKTLFTTFFKNPFNGILAIFQNPPEKSFVHSMIIYASLFVLYILGFLLLAGEARGFMPFGAYISIGLTPILIMLAISGLSFLVKSISGKPNFKNELLTGALCGIPLALVIPLALIAKVFGDGVNTMALFANPLGAGLFMSLIMLYLILMMINVFQQSLKSAGTKELLAWYISPLAIMLSFYIAFSISKNLF